MRQHIWNLCDYESMGHDTVVDQKHCAPHIATVMNSSPRHVVTSAQYRVEYDRVYHYWYTTQHLKGKNTIYTVKLLDGAHSIAKFATLNRNWRITDD